MTNTAPRQPEAGRGPTAAGVTTPAARKKAPRRAIANDMNDQSIGNFALDLANIEQMIGRAISPTLHPLLARHRRHECAQAIPGIVALVQNLAADLFCFQSRHLEQLTSRPGLQAFLSAGA